jgi:hypothetical protein
MAKLKFPKEEQFIEALIKYYLINQEKLINIIATTEVKRTVSAYQKSITKQVTAVIKELNSSAIDWSNTNIPLQYKKGLESAVKSYAALNINIDVGQFARINERKIELLVGNTISDFTNANNFVGRSILDDVRKAGIDATISKELTGQTVKGMKDSLITTLIDKNITSIKTASGRRLNLASYAEIVARSTTREAQNRGLIDTVQNSGRDLVQMSSHATTCPVCEPLQGRVYSISGTNPDYPRLDFAFGAGHANIHPNCRHSLFPYVPELDKRREWNLDFSNRDFNIDNRSQTQIDNYNKEQKRKRELNRDRRQWERYKLAMPNETPKTLSAFRKSKKSNGDNWQALESQYRSIRLTKSQ